LTAARSGYTRFCENHFRFDRCTIGLHAISRGIFFLSFLSLWGERKERNETKKEKRETLTVRPYLTVPTATVTKEENPPQAWLCCVVPDRMVTMAASPSGSP
jgi:hypothetical protein